MVIKISLRLMTKGSIIWLRDAVSFGAVCSGMIAKRRQRIFAHEAERTAQWLRAIAEEYVPRKKLSFAGRFSSTLTKLRGVSSFIRRKKSVTASANSTTTSVSTQGSALTSISGRTARTASSRPQVARSRASLTGRNFLYAAANAAEAKVAAKQKEEEEAAEVSPWKTVAKKMGVENLQTAKPASVMAILAAMQPSKGEGAGRGRAWSVGKDLSVSRRSTSVLVPNSGPGGMLVPRPTQQRRPSVLREQAAAGSPSPGGRGSGGGSPQEQSSHKGIPEKRRAHSVTDMSALRDQFVAQGTADSPPAASQRISDAAADGPNTHRKLPLTVGGSPEVSASTEEGEPLLPPLGEFNMRKGGAADADAFQGLLTDAAQASPLPVVRGGMWRTRSMRRRETQGTEEEDIDEEEWRSLPGEGGREALSTKRKKLDGVRTLDIWNGLIYLVVQSRLGFILAPCLNGSATR